MATSKKGFKGFYVIILKNKNIKYEYGLHPMHVGRFYSVYEELKRFECIDSARKHIEKRVESIQKAGFSLDDVNIRYYPKQPKQV